MITILHGNDISSSRNIYLQEKQKNTNSVVFSADNLNYDILFQTLEGEELFSKEKSVFIENFFANSRTNSLEFKKIIEYLNKKSSENILFWENKEISKAQSTSIEHAKVLLFNYPQILFTFLDNIYPNNYKILNLFKSLRQTMEVELIFYMIVRQFRLLVALLEPATSQIDELKRLAPWQVAKFKKQLSFFDKDKLLKNYKKLYELDYGSKFGLLPYSLESAIDIFLLDL